MLTTTDFCDTLLVDESIGFDAWEDATLVTKTKALKQANRLINNLSFKGTPTVETQDDAFPRNGDTTIPTDIQEACAYLANALIDGRSVDDEYEVSLMKSQGYSNIRSSHETEAPKIHVLCGIISYDAWLKLLPYLALDKTPKLMRS